MIPSLQGCSSDSSSDASSSSSDVETVVIESIAGGLTSPVAMAIPGDRSKRKFIVDQVGKIFIIDSGNHLLPTPFLDVSDRLVALMRNYDERGLLGLAFHPDYINNGRFFIFYTAPKGTDVPADFDSETHISEFQVSQDDPNQADPNSEMVLLVIPKPQFNHNGGTLLFGPDGLLYVSVGDGGSSNDVGVGHTTDLGNAQDKSSFLGKILRLDVDHGSPYTIPADNPFVNEYGVKGEIWAYGLRNPYRMSFDTGQGQRLFIADVGQNLYEEIDIGIAGGNYGWNLKEGNHCFDPNHADTPPATCTSVGQDGLPLQSPIIEYAHTDNLGNHFGIAVVGGFVYRGNAIPALFGQYIFGDLSTIFSTPDGSLFAASENDNGSWTYRPLKIAGQATTRMDRFILGFGQDQDGEIYILTSQNIGPSGNTGQVYKITAASP